MKKITFLFLLALLPLMASAYDAEIDGIYYELSGTEATLRNAANYTGSVTIPATVTYGGVTYSVTKIGDNAFSYCSGLTSVTIPNSVTTIGSSAFAGCTGLTSVTIPNSVTLIGGGAFAGTAWYDNQPDGLVYAGKVAYGYKGTMPENTSISLEEGTLSIAQYALAYCTGLTSVTIPSSVTSIGRGAFEGTTWFNNQPDGLVYAGKVAYGYKGTMPENTSISIVEGTLGVAQEAFAYCAGLTSVTIPNSVTEIGWSAFSGCSGLTSVTIGNSVTSIGYYAFSYCRGLTSVTIPNSVTSIGEAAFAYSTGLTSVTIPSNVKKIGINAFRECSGLTSVTVPNSVTEIGNYAFSGCSGLTDVCCYAEDVPTTGNNAFNVSPISTATLHVPAASISAYQTTSPWSGFGSIVALDDEPVAEGIAINETNFPDENFRNWILSQEYGKDGVLTDDEIANVTAMYVGLGDRILNMQGIEFFTALKILDVSSRNITSLDVSKNTALEYLDCSCNMITSLDVSQNKELKNLSCLGNGLTSLDVSECTALQSIDCQYNLLTSLDVSGCTALRKLDCEHNQLTSLDVSNKKELYWLMCYNNQLTSLDVSGCPNFLTLSFYCNQIKGAAMDKLVEDLPAVDFENWMGVIYFENEGNVMTTTQVAAARAKNWIPRYAINENEGQDYEGSEPEVKKCATPTISFVGGKIVFDCETEGVEFVSEVTCSDSGKYSGSEIPVTSTYTVSVYAKKDGYEDSDVATKEITVGGSTGIKGDVNEDGTVNGTDIQEVINTIVNAD